MRSETPIPFFVKKKICPLYIYILFIFHCQNIEHIYIYIFCIETIPLACELVEGRNHLLMLESIALNQVVWVRPTPTPQGHCYSLAMDDYFVNCEPLKKNIPATKDRCLG